MLRKTSRLAVAVIASIAVIGSAENFPLTLRTMTPDEAMRWSECVVSSYGTIHVARPASIKAEPQSVSSLPIYGVLSIDYGDILIVFKLDESQGDGKGYDRLIIDLNRNYDLTDDPALAAIDVAEQPPTRPETKHALFGPIQAFNDRAVGAWQPLYYVQCSINKNALARQRFSRGIYRRNPCGDLLLLAGCYMAAEVDLNGLRQTIGFLDGNGNMRLGDLIAVNKRHPDFAKIVNVVQGDLLLRDRNNSGSFECDRFKTEAEPLNKIVYFGARPYRMTLADDFESVSFEPVAGPTGELVVQPHADQVYSLALVRETLPEGYELLNLSAPTTRMHVPAGVYRLYSCLLWASCGDGQFVIIEGFNFFPNERSVTVAPGKTATLSCGPPLELRLHADKRQTPGTKPPNTIWSSISRFFGKEPAAGQQELRISAMVIGAYGENCTRFAKGNDQQSLPPPPQFKILDSSGRQVASGNLDYG